MIPHVAITCAGEHGTAVTHTASVIWIMGMVQGLAQGLRLRLY